MDKDSPDHPINVFVKDKHGTLISGANVTWTVVHNGKEKTAGPASMQGVDNTPVTIAIPPNVDEFVRIAATVNGKTKTVWVKKDNPNIHISFEDVDVTPPKPPTHHVRGQGVLFAILAVVCLVGIACVGAGVWLVALKDTGGSDIDILGMTIKTGSVGVAAIFIGAVLVLVAVRSLLKTLGDLARH